MGRVSSRTLRPAARARQVRRRADPISAPMRGTAADINKRAMLAVHRWRSDQPHARLLMQVHDELVLRVDVGVGRNWDEAY